MSKSEHGTSGGVELTEDLIERLAAEADRGYPTEQLRRRARRGRPPIGLEAATVFQVRLEPELHGSLLRAARSDHVSASEAARRALWTYVESRADAGDVLAPVERGALGAVSGLEVAAVLRRLRAILDTPGLDNLVAAYFDHGGGYAGTSFDLLGDNPPDRFTPDDLLAVSMLNIEWTPRAVRRLLSADSAAHIADLRQVRHVDLWESDKDDTTLVSAGRLWTWLCGGRDGVGAVAAGKLLARKRPRLIPIADSVVLAALKPPRGKFWITLRECLKDQAVRQSIEQLRPATAEAITTLRLLDVAIWMRCSRTAAATRSRLGISDWTEPSGAHT